MSQLAATLSFRCLALLSENWYEGRAGAQAPGAVFPHLAEPQLRRWLSAPQVAISPPGHPIVTSSNLAVATWLANRTWSGWPPGELEGYALLSGATCTPSLHALTYARTPPSGVCRTGHFSCLVGHPIHVTSGDRSSLVSRRVRMPTGGSAGQDGIFLW